MFEPLYTFNKPMLMSISLYNLSDVSSPFYKKYFRSYMHTSRCIYILYPGISNKFVELSVCKSRAFFVQQRLRARTLITRGITRDFISQRRPLFFSFFFRSGRKNNGGERARVPHVRRCKMQEWRYRAPLRAGFFS